ncbi:hypothetical protein SAMN04488009_0685 [Maribacter sedimenticola]|uniref:Helix-turn-helix domain-containing protein n=1 Tax=Maribacter sedimenticola TaxID=228956 RepID=A0ABY1SDK0_9FLAO|nr:hypothetical protein [Maribacter sedimenticola]SNR27721.1 hypothetical protein SAMN04488009_0685 [Maribacter sedimenticola]
MNEKIIGEIVYEVFKKAKNEHPKHSKFALSNHISNETDLSSRTLERAYDRYLNKKTKYGKPNADSIDLFCKYLGYENFKDYVQIAPPPAKELPVTVRNKRRLIITISIAFGMVLLMFGYQNWIVNQRDIKSVSPSCMTWADSVYVAVTCDHGQLSNYGTPIIPLDKVKLTSFKKVKVSQSYNFFNENDMPLIWYSKNKDQEIEYFTSPGLHPVTGETLRKITPYIIQTYVPLHVDKASSFVP